MLVGPDVLSVHAGSLFAQCISCMCVFVRSGDELQGLLHTSLCTDVLNDYYLVQVQHILLAVSMHMTALTVMLHFLAKTAVASNPLKCYE